MAFWSRREPGPFDTFVVETSHWWSGHQTLIVPESIRAMRWLDQTVNGVVTRHQIESAPACDAALLLERRDEETLFMHHDSAGYWGQPL